jgi:DNA polymerase
MSKFFSGVKISAVHGQMQKIGERFVIPMFHPAAALHQSALKPTILGDFAKLPDQLREARAALGKPAVVERVKKKVEEIPNDMPKQLNLF